MSQPFQPFLTCSLGDQVIGRKNILSPPVPPHHTTDTLSRVDQKCFQIVLIPPSRHVRRKISAGADGGLSGGSSVRNPWSEGPQVLY